MSRATPLLIASCFLAGCGGGGDGSRATSLLPSAQPLTVHGEAMVLHGDTPAALEHGATGVLAVYGYDNTGRRIDYTPGLDFTYASGAVTATATSRIPDFDGYAYTTINAAGQFAFTASPRNPPLTMIYDVYVDYASTVPDEVIPARGKSYQRVLCVGDSITAGADTVASFYFNSDADSFCGLLRSYTGAQVDIHAVVGGSLAGAVPDLPQYLSAQPQVAVIAFGMNDHLAGAAGLDAFRSTLDAAVTALQNADVDVILVGFLQQNKLWVLEDPAQTQAYNQAIADTASAHGVPFVDPRPRFGDGGLAPIERLTGDFMHHPNQEGQRRYFSLLLPYFLAQPVLESGIAEFVP